MVVMSKVPSLEGISSDNDRVNALFAPFRPRESNPEHYDRKMKFWMKAIEEYGVHCGKLSFTIKELQSAFRIETKSPVCLNEVVNQFLREGKILTEFDFNENLKASESWSAWSQTSARRALRKVGSYIPSPITFFYKPVENEIRFVNMDHVKTLQESVLAESALLNKLMSVQSWKAKVSEISKLTDDLELEYFLEYLKSRKHVIVDKIGSEQVLLMVSAGTLPKISAVEKGKYDIFCTKEMLETQLSDITEKAEQAEERARASLKQGRRNTAKHELRRKKLLEQRMEKLLTMIDNLTVLGMQIEDAESDAVMISAYEAGKKALSGVLEDKRLDPDRVTEAMLDIRELLDQHADVSNALSQPMEDQGTDVSELEAELESLMKEDEEKSISELPNPVKEPPLPPVKSDEEEALKLLEDLDLEGKTYTESEESSVSFSKVHVIRRSINKS